MEVVPNANGMAPTARMVAQPVDKVSVERDILFGMVNAFQSDEDIYN
jgi:hypothetical protein